MKYELHPCYFITDFVTAIFEHRSVALLMLSHPPLPIKRIKQKKKLLDFIELVGYCFCFISLLQSKFQILSFLQYHIYFS